MDEVREWQSRALKRMYLIVSYGALRFKNCTAAVARARTTVHWALGVNHDRVREVFVNGLLPVTNYLMSSRPALLRGSI